MVEKGFRRIDIFGAVLIHGASAEGKDLTRGAGDRKHDTVTKPVVMPSARLPGRYQAQGRRQFQRGPLPGKKLK